MRTVYLDSVRNDPSRSRTRLARRRGGRIRTAPSLPNRLIICDKKIAIVAVDPDDTSPGRWSSGRLEVVSSLYGPFR